MSHIQLLTLPQPVFAHVYSSADYQNVIPAETDALEISLLSEGEFRLTQDGQSYRAVAGDYICNALGSALYVSSKGEHRQHTVRFSCRYENWALPLVLHPVTTGNRCKNLLDEIIRIHTLDSKRVLTCSGLFLQVLDELERMKVHSGDVIPYSPYISRAKSYIFEHIHEPIRQADIAGHLGITPEYLYAVFKRSEGISLIPYINTVKLENISGVMKREGISLRQAAARYGYSDPNYVSRMYKQLFGRNITDALR